MAVSREQVVQIGEAAGMVFIKQVDGSVLPEHCDIIEKLINLARADLEATIEKQATDYNRIIEKCGEAVIELKATIAEQTKELAALKLEWEKESIEADNWSDKYEELRQQLQASQAREAQLREAIVSYRKANLLKQERVRDPNFNWGDAEAVDYIDHEEIMALLTLDSIADKALATPSDDSALREYGAKLVEKISGMTLSTYALKQMANQIREGTFK